MMAMLCGYGMGLRACVWLQIEDVGFGRRQMTMHSANDRKGRLAMLAVSLVEPLRRQVVYAKSMHADDLPPGFGRVYLPYALKRKSPSVNASWRAVCIWADTSKWGHF